MGKFYSIPAYAFISICLFISCKHKPQNGFLNSIDGDNEEKYDNPNSRDSLEFEKLKDPSLGYVPMERLGRAIDYTENQKKIARQSRDASLTWTERGPISDTVGVSNFNIRGAGN